MPPARLAPPWALLPVLVILTGCPSSDSGRTPDADAAAAVSTNSYGLRGQVLPGPLAKPSIVLTDGTGPSYDPRAETDGKLTLLFFGYTYCPDVCPIHMANIASVMKQMLPSQRGRIAVVFVTTDPARDTPERLRTWLANFDPAFVGLTGDTAIINAAQRSLYLPMPQYDEPDSTGAYGVGHAAAVLAFTPSDNQARVYYPFGTRQADWANDLSRLLDITWTGE